MRRLENKVSIITGGAGSIGIAAAKLFLAEGASVLLVDVKEEALQKAVAELNSQKVKYCVADVTKSADVKKYAQYAVAEFGTIDVFFNNAGIEGVVCAMVDYPEDIFDKIIAVNVKGIWLDEFNSHWISKELILNYLNQGKKICVVSPDLHKRAYLLEWETYKNKEIKMNDQFENFWLCTDYPETAKSYFYED